MAKNREKQQQFEIDLDLSNIPRSQRAQVKANVGEFVVNEIIRNISQGKSPVSGERFSRLDKEYANDKKGGDRTPNLQLDGDMVASLGFRNTMDGVTVGIMSSKERPKADGHNNFTGLSKLPKRRFIPGEDQSFKGSINSGINTILSRARAVSDVFEATPQQAEIPTVQIDFNITEDTVAGIIGQIFGDNNGQS